MTVALLTIGFASISEAIFYATDIVSARNTTKLMINQLLDTVEYTSAIAAYTNNEQIAKEVIQGLMRNNFIQRVKIQGDQGLWIEHNKNSNSDITIEIIRPLISPFDHQQVIGSVSIAPYDYYPLAEIITNPSLSIIKVLLLISVTSAIILWVLRRNILKKLSFISDSLQQIGSSEQFGIAPLNPQQFDELEQLVNQVNTLVETLAAQTQKEQALYAKIAALECKLQHGSSEPPHAG